MSNFIILIASAIFNVVTAQISKQHSYRHCTSPREMLKTTQIKSQLKTLAVIITNGAL